MSAPPSIGPGQQMGPGVGGQPVPVPPNRDQDAAGKLKLQVLQLKEGIHTLTQLIKNNEKPDGPKIPIDKPLEDVFVYCNAIEYSLKLISEYVVTTTDSKKNIQHNQIVARNLDCTTYDSIPNHEYMNYNQLVSLSRHQMEFLKKMQDSTREMSKYAANIEPYTQHSQQQPLQPSQPQPHHH